MAADGGLSIQSVIFFRNGEQQGTNISADGDEGAPFTTESWVLGSDNILQADPGIRDPFDLVSPDFRPAPQALALTGWRALPPPIRDHFAFEPARFLGAMGQSKEPDPDAPYLGNWVAGWTNFEPR